MPDPASYYSQAPLGVICVVLSLLFVLMCALWRAAADRERVYLGNWRSCADREQFFRGRVDQLDAQIDELKAGPPRAVWVTGEYPLQVLNGCDDVLTVSEIVADVSTCPRCNGSHEDLKFTAFDHPVLGHFTHWANCEKTDDPILIRAVGTEESGVRLPPDGDPVDCRPSPHH